MPSTTSFRGTRPAARGSFPGAFDRLAEAREYFSLVETHLIDLTLVAETTIGESLRRELASQQPINLLRLRGGRRAVGSA